MRHGLGDARTPPQCGLHVPQLDAESANLDLAVAPTDELHRAVRPVPPQIPGPVHAIVRRLRERVDHEAFGRQHRIVQVSAGEVRRPHLDLAELADAGQLAGVVHDQELGALDALPQRNRGRSARRRLRHSVAGDGLRGLGGAVEVHASGVRRDATHTVHHRRGQDVAAEEDVPQAGKPEAGPSFGQERRHAAASRAPR